MERIRTAVVGLNQGLMHVVEVLANPRFHLAAVCDSDERKLAWLRGEPAVDNEPAWYRAHRAALLDRARAHPELARVALTADVQALLELPEIDAVVLSVPIRLNVPLAARGPVAGNPHP